EPTGSGLIIGLFSPTSSDWNNIELTKTYLNNSNTDNNMWFIGLYKTGGPTDTVNWRFKSDSNGDNSEAYYYSEGWLHLTQDYECKVYIAPHNNHPNPEHIGLKVNNSAVTGYLNINGSGYWSSNEEYSSSTGKLDFNITSDWYNVSCQITNVEINYTKSDITANSKFNISENNDNVIWNDTIDENINSFETDFGKKYINFTIPSSWDLIQAFKGGVEKTNTTWDRGDGWQIVKASEGENGNFWGLNASSSNLISDVGILVGGV
ncbi:unnamed protein product, partial [marine sediment metagenome]